MTPSKPDWVFSFLPTNTYIFRKGWPRLYMFFITLSGLPKNGEGKVCLLHFSPYFFSTLLETSLLISPKIHSSIPNLSSVYAAVTVSFSDKH